VPLVRVVHKGPHVFHLTREHPQPRFHVPLQALLLLQLLALGLELLLQLSEGRGLRCGLRLNLAQRALVLPHLLLGGDPRIELGSLVPTTRYVINM